MQEGTACLRFGQSCLSMTVNASANAMEKEQQEMRSVIKEQIQEINTLQDENEQLRRELEEEKARKASVAADDIPDFLIAQHIALNKDALMDDLKEADEEIVALRQALEEKGEEMAALEATSIEEQLAGMTDGLAGMDGQQAAEIMEQKRNAIMKERMQVKAKLQQEKLAFEKELDQVRDATPTRRASCALAPHLAPPDNPPSTPSTPSTLTPPPPPLPLPDARDPGEAAGEAAHRRGDEAKQEKAIQEAAREQAAAIVADMEEKAAAMESALREREAQQAAMDEAKANSEKELKEELARSRSWWRPRRRRGRRSRRARRRTTRRWPRSSPS